MTGGAAQYSGEENVVITAGGLSGILNTLFVAFEPGEGVLLTDPTYIGLINRVKLAGVVPIRFDLGGGAKDLYRRQRIERATSNRLARGLDRRARVGDARYPARGDGERGRPRWYRTESGTSGFGRLRRGLSGF